MASNVEERLVCPRCEICRLGGKKKVNLSSVCLYKQHKREGGKYLIESGVHCQLQQLHLDGFDPQGLQLIPLTTAKVMAHTAVLQSLNYKERNN